LSRARVGGDWCIDPDVEAFENGRRHLRVDDASEHA
jgi:hypothetical protein